MYGQDCNNVVSNIINEHLVKLMKSSNAADKVGGILAMSTPSRLHSLMGELHVVTGPQKPDELSEMELDEKVRLSGWSTLLRLALQATDPQVIVLASQQLGILRNMLRPFCLIKKIILIAHYLERKGRMAQAGGSPTASFIEGEVRRALQNMKAESRR